MNIQQLKNKDLLNKALSLVSPDRQQRIVNMPENSEKLRVLAAGVLINEGLKACGLSSATETIEKGPFGKPFLPNHPMIHFNVSHSGNLAVAVFSDCPVGIDVEHIRAIRPNLVNYTLDEVELKEYEASGEEDKIMMFLQFWTKKEAFFKYNETGINIRPREINKTYGDKISKLYFKTFREYPEHVITLCSESEDVTLTNFVL